MSDSQQTEAFFDKYFDISDVLINYYANQPTIGIDRHFLLIEDFLAKEIENPEDNKPLVIQCEEDFGVKTFLVKWMLYHQKNYSTSYPLQDIILPYFVTSSEKNTNYYFAIFRFLMLLREKLNIKQKVELLEEKLRRFFGYWLGVCNRKIEKKIIKQKISEQSKIIILIHKIDNFVDPQLGKAANIGFWLPKSLPSKVRVIATCHKDSEAFNYFEKIGSTIIRAQNDKTMTAFMIDTYSNRQTFVEADHKNKIMECLKKIPEKNLLNCKFLKTFISCLIPYGDEKIIKYSDLDGKVWLNFYRDFEYDKLEKLDGNEDLIDFLFSYYEKKIMATEKFRKLILILSLCYKGLMFSELIQLVKFSTEEWNLFLAIFKRFIVQFKGLFCCYDPSFKRVAIRKYTNEKDSNLLHEEIANILERTPLSTRKLEEQTYHLFISKSYFRLKETVSIIEHFLLLFNPHIKYDLCHYWEKLLENGFDPAVEYNKAIEGFEMHYKPSSEDIFQIILQVSRFLKEFADFETDKTPQFKHPPISGFSELSQIGLEKEIMKVGMYKKPDNKRNHSILTSLESKNMKKMSSHEEFRQHFIEKMGILGNSNEIFIEDNENSKEASEDSFSEASESHINLNFSRNPIEDLKVKLDNNNISSINNIQLSQINNSTTINNEIVSKLNSVFSESKKIDSIAVYHSGANDKPPSYYYYKRWLWMIFPWACISNNKKCNYSENIMQCYSSATSYISVVTERKFTERALKIALDAKLKKKMMYAKKEELEELMTLKNMKPPPSPTLKKGVKSILASQKLQLEKNLGEVSNESASQTSNSKFPMGQKNKDRISTLSLGAIKKNQGGGAFFITEQLMPGSLSGIGDNLLLNRSKMMELKFREYNPEKVMYLNKSLEESSLIVLPKLKGSINKHSDDELYILEKKVKYFKDQYDSTLYMNQKLAKELSELEKIALNQSNKSQDLIFSELLKERIEELEKVLKNVEDTYQKTTSERNRISTVLSVCMKNKHQNEEYIRSLNFLLQNFKSCIKIEGDEIKKNRNEIIHLKKISQELLKAVETKMNNHNNLVYHIKNNINSKMQFSRDYDKSDQIFENSILEALEDTEKQKSISHQEKKKIKMRLSQMERTTRSLEGKLDKYEEDCQKLKNIFETDENEILKTQKYKTFMDGLERKNELIREIIAKNDKLSFLKEELNRKTKIYERYSKFHSQEQEESLTNNQILASQKKLEKEFDSLANKFVVFKKSKLTANLTFKSIFEKYGIKADEEELNEEKFKEFSLKIDEYLQTIKAKYSEEDYNKIMQGNYQILEVYKNVIPKGTLLSNCQPEFSEEEF